jgi:hypothetical protein
LPLRIWILWGCFLVRGIFYIWLLPPWEGWDEYAHLAYVQYWADRGTLPRASDRISREIDEAMRLAPLPNELSWIGPPYLIHSDWWALPSDARQSRLQSLAALSPGLAHEPAVPINGRPFVFYEAQQPPLFYWIASPFLRARASRPIADRIHLLRLLSLVLTSLAIPFTFLAAGFAFPDKTPAALCCAALLAVAPGLVIDSARVANDGLSIGLASVFLWLVMRKQTAWPALGIVLGLAILSKASLLVLIPVFIVVWIKQPKRLALALATAFAIGAWWYIRNLTIGAPLTGWQESVSLRALTASALQLSRTGRWVNGAYTVAKSFTWFGAWSFMTLRSWMYLILEGCAFGGMLAGVALRRESIRIPLLLTVCFTIAIAGGAAAYNAVHEIPGIPGWYLWPAGGAMAMIFAAGARRYSAAYAGMLALADLFGSTSRMAPYYAGLAPWNHGSVTQFAAALTRLHVSWWLASFWLAATLVIPALMLQGRAKTRT